MFGQYFFEAKTHLLHSFKNTGVNFYLYNEVPRALDDGAKDLCAYLAMSQDLQRLIPFCISNYFLLRNVLHYFMYNSRMRKVGEMRFSPIERSCLGYWRSQELGRRVAQLLITCLNLSKVLHIFIKSF